MSVDRDGDPSTAESRYVLKGVDSVSAQELGLVLTALDGHLNLSAAFYPVMMALHSSRLEPFTLVSGARHFSNTLSAEKRKSGPVELIGGDHDDVLVGSPLSYDVLRGGKGSDKLDGGPGEHDMASYRESVEPVRVILNGLKKSLVFVGNRPEDILNGIEDLEGGFGPDVLTGDEMANHLCGNGGDDLLYGEEGNDILHGGEGKDTLDGGDGDRDTAVYDEKTLPVVITLSGNVDAVAYVGGVAEDLVRNIEYVEGGEGEDLLVGDHRHNAFWGNGGDDVLLGRDGNDWLDGGEGNDILDGGPGDDVVEYVQRGALSIYVHLNDSGNSVVYVNGIAEDTLRSIENVAAGPGDDHLIGDSRSNRLWGYGGNDILEGGAGDDFLDGGTGRNVLDGGDGIDRVIYSSRSGRVVVVLNGSRDSAVRVDGVQQDTLRNIEQIESGPGPDYLAGDSLDNWFRGGPGNDVLKGEGGDDHLYGDQGRDVLEGDEGNDILVGGSGADSLTGGSGADSFRYFRVSDMRGDTITDFNRAEGDTIWLHSRRDANPRVSGRQAFSFTDATPTPYSLWYHVQDSGTDLMLLGDTDGDTDGDTGSQEVFISLLGVSALQASDLIM